MRRGAEPLAVAAVPFDEQQLARSMARTRTKTEAAAPYLSLAQPGQPRDCRLAVEDDLQHLLVWLA